MHFPIKPCNENFQLPVYSSSGAGAFDIFSPVDLTIHRHETILAPLGFHAAVPEGHVALLLTRSGLGCKQGLGLRNQVGVIDSDYRGEWMAKLTMDSFDDQDSNSSPSLNIKTGDRILQCIIIQSIRPAFEIVEFLNTTKRGEGSFGSTGV